MSGRTRVVVAMSGGVDSSVAAALLIKQGYEVIGATLRLWRDDPCAAPAAAHDARRVAEALGIPWHEIDSADRFKEQVVEPFISEYTRGRTPNPCLTCNRYIKFGYLMQVARSLGADRLATGHYVRLVQAGGLFRLLRGVDRNKDQSYVLYMLGQEQLRQACFPVGGYTKQEIRALAHDWDLPVATKPESQDICFIHDRDYRRFLRDYAPQAIRPGPILDREGRPLGEHQGLPFYTIGQRQGLGIAWSEPLYVLALDAGRNALIVGPASALGHPALRVREAGYIAGAPPPSPAAITTRIRYTGSEVPATLYPEPEGAARVQLDVPLRDITPGQAAVFYQGEEVLGGGVIDEAVG